LCINLESVVTGAGLADDPPVLCERRRISLGAQFVQELRRALDVGEEEGDGSCREVGAHGEIIRPERT